MRKRSKYKPKGVRLDTVTWIVNGFRRAADAGNGTIITNTRLKNHSSLEALRTGTADRDDLDVLISAFNVTEALCIMKIGDEYRGEINAAQNAIYNLGVRAVERGKFLATGSELVAINTAMELHDAQLDVCTVSELEQALDYVWKQIAHKRVRVIPTKKVEA